MNPVSGSAAVPPSMFTPPLAPGAYHEHGNSVLPSIAGSGNEVRAHPALLRERERRGLDLRRVVDQIRFDEALLRERRGLRSESAASATTSRPARRSCRTGVSTIGQIGWPVTRSSTYTESLLRRLREDLARLPVDRHVEQIRRHRRVVVPDVVMDELVVPLALARLHVERDDARAEQVVARTMAAELVDQRPCPSGCTRGRDPDPPSTAPTRRPCRRRSCRSSIRSPTSPRRTRPAAESC